MMDGAMDFGVRTVNERGVALIKQFEGLRLNAYLCPGHVYTVGWGHTRTTRQGQKITVPEAEALLKTDLQYVSLAITPLIKVPVNDNQFAALASFAFNVGISNFSSSTLLRLLNRGWYEQVPAQLMRWTKVQGEELGGLARRRKAEATLWNTTL